MSARTAAAHCHTELEYVAADDLNETVTFRARSASKPGQYNLVQLCILTGETLCDCRGAEFGRECWHADLVAVAWLNHAAVCLARRYNDTQLGTAGRKAKRMIDAYRGRSWRVLPDDQLALLACRTAYRERWAPALAAAEAAEVAA
jgi:hypothetical protein